MKLEYYRDNWGLSSEWALPKTPLMHHWRLWKKKYARNAKKPNRGEDRHEAGMSPR